MPNSNSNSFTNQPPNRPMSTINPSFMPQHQIPMRDFSEQRPSTRLQQPASMTHFPPQTQSHTPGAGMQASTPMMGGSVSTRQRFQPLQNSRMTNVATDSLGQRQQFGKFRPASIQPTSSYPQRFTHQGA